MTNGSTLIFGGNKTKREQKANDLIGRIGFSLQDQNNPDLFVLSKQPKKNSIGISEVRKAIKFLETKPYKSKYKSVVISEAHFLTTQAQNALLKTLEEPPSYAMLILTAKTEDSLLETILSRCRRINLLSGLDYAKETKYKLNDAKDVGSKLLLAEKLAKEDKDVILETIDNWIVSTREAALENPNIINAQKLEVLVKVKTDLEETNINTRLALEYLLLQL